MANDRDCENCVHKVNGACNVWECKFEPKRGMTREEAKALLLNISAYDIDTQRGMKKQEAIEMAIKALQQEPCEDATLKDIFCMGCEYKEQEPMTEKVIKMRDATPEERESMAKYIKSISKPTRVDFWNLEQEPCDKCVYSTNEGCQYDDITEAIPPVDPQPKTGRWIRVDKDKLRCSECEVIHLIAQYPNGKVDWCPNCGTKMVEPQEGGDQE